MKKMIYVFAVSAFTLMFVSCGKKAETDSKEVAEDQNEEKFDNTDVQKDTDFTVEIADASMLEVQLGQLAIANASSPDVKQLGQMMVDDHTKANEELKTLAQQKNITLPAALSDKSQKHYEDLAKKTGTDFDKEYTDMMVKGHKDVLDKLKKEADNGKDPDVKAWASGKVPTIEHHLMMSENAQKVVKDSKGK
jgi:putative membrane protein